MKDIFSMEECLKELKKIHDETVEIQKTWKDKGTEVAEIELKLLKLREDVIKQMIKIHEHAGGKKHKSISQKDREEIKKMIKDKSQLKA